MNPGFEALVLVRANLWLDLCSQVKGFLRLSEFQVAVAAFGEDGAHSPENKLRAVAVVHVEAVCHGARAVNGALKAQLVAKAGIDAGKIGVDEGDNVLAC